MRDIVTDEDDRLIVWSTLDLARNLGMRTVAEGIESPETVQMLSMMGCSMGAGLPLRPSARCRCVLAWCVEQHRLGAVRLLRPLDQPLTGQHDLADPASLTRPRGGFPRSRATDRAKPEPPAVVGDAGEPGSSAA